MPFTNSHERESSSFTIPNEPKKGSWDFANVDMRDHFGALKEHALDVPVEEAALRAAYLMEYLPSHYTIGRKPRHLE